jgi:hypothetical protein
VKSRHHRPNPWLLGDPALAIVTAGPQREDRTAAKRGPNRSGASRFNSDKGRFGSRVPWLREITALGEPQPPGQQFDRRLAAGCGWPVRTLTGCLVRAPVVVVRATRCGACGLSFVKPSDA